MYAAIDDRDTARSLFERAGLDLEAVVKPIGWLYWACQISFIACRIEDRNIGFHTGPEKSAIR